MSQCHKWSETKRGKMHLNVIKILFQYATEQRILLTLEDFICSMNPERNN